MLQYSEERKKEQGSVKEAERNTGRETEKQETQPQRERATRSKVLNVPAGCQRHRRHHVTLLLMAMPALPRVPGCCWLWLRRDHAAEERPSVGTSSQEIGFQQLRKFKNQIEGNVVKSRKVFCK